MNYTIRLIISMLIGVYSNAVAVTQEETTSSMQQVPVITVEDIDTNEKEIIMHDDIQNFHDDVQDKNISEDDFSDDDFLSDVAEHCADVVTEKPAISYVDYAKFALYVMYVYAWQKPIEFSSSYIKKLYSLIYKKLHYKKYTIHRTIQAPHAKKNLHSIK